MWSVKTCIELNDFVSDDQHYKKINGTRRPLCDDLKFVCAVLLIENVKSPQCFVQFAADFAAVIKIGEHFRKNGICTNKFRRSSPIGQMGFPIRNRTTQCG